MKSIAAFIILSTFFLASCASPPSSKQIPPAVLTLRENNTFTARLQVAMASATKEGRNAVLATCSVIDVPIYWKGNVFNGSGYVGSDRNAISTVRGSLSEDGEWVEHLDFSTKHADNSTTDTEFSVSIRHVPITAASPGATTVIVCDKTGDVGKHVESLSWIQQNIAYSFPDWAGLSGFGPPTLRILFKKDVQQKPQQDPPLVCPMHQ
jgi:hypothetical protein